MLSGRVIHADVTKRVAKESQRETGVVAAPLLVRAVEVYQRNSQKQPAAHKSTLTKIKSYAGAAPIAATSADTRASNSAKSSDSPIE
jgi:hypothetical protein